MTHELHLGAAIPENPGLALKAEEQEDSEPDEDEVATLVRKIKRFYRNSKPGNLRGRNSVRKSSGSKSDQGCFKCGDSDHQIKDCPQWKNEKGKGKGKDQYKERFNKSTFAKPNFKKAMIEAWEEATDSEEDEDQSDEETANLCLMAKIDGTTQDPSSEVRSSTLLSLSKTKLVELLIETLDIFKKLIVIKAQSDKAMELSKEHTTYLDNVKSDVHGRFFQLPVRNTSLKDSFERVKKVYIMLDEANNADEIQEQEDFEIGLIRFTDNDEEISPGRHQNGIEDPQTQETASNQKVPVQRNPRAPDPEEPENDDSEEPEEDQETSDAEEQGSQETEGTEETLDVPVPRNHAESLKDTDWITAKQNELNEFQRNKVWHLESKPKNQKVIGSMWVFRNKLDKHTTIIRNKASLYGT
ncbi:uncharacterized protein [Spinacia oleracea]|uniref:CCHC-type domain-containing protein n=1 Tax=Spinacia oleracea TaxID=3562 RepID=A0ABM3RSA1_SPIOL|nr:uncharacterized protein LOC130472095 [Spinacia oleracea]